MADMAHRSEKGYRLQQVIFPMRAEIKDTALVLRTQFPMNGQPEMNLHCRRGVPAQSSPGFPAMAAALLPRCFPAFLLCGACACGKTAIARKAFLIGLNCCAVFKPRWRAQGKCGTSAKQ
jgi:hypothetical protein